MTNATPSRRLGHVPVLLDEVIALLEPRDGAFFVDGTFGCGGYSEALLASAACHVVAIDRDPDAQDFAAKLKEGNEARFDFITGNFGVMDKHLKA